MQSPRYTSEVERDARAARMVGKSEVEAAAAIEPGGSCERVEVLQPRHALDPESRGAIERGQWYPKVDGAIGKVVHAIHVWPDRGLLFGRRLHSDGWHACIPERRLTIGSAAQQVGGIRASCGYVGRDVLADEGLERCMEHRGGLSVSDGVLQPDLLLGDSAVRVAVRREVWDRAVQLLQPTLEPQEAGEAGCEAFGRCTPPLQSLLLQ